MLKVKTSEPIYVNFRYRCTVHSTAVGGSLTSQHLIGRAKDIRTAKLRPKELAPLAEK